MSEAGKVTATALVGLEDNQIRVLQHLLEFLEKAGAAGISVNFVAANGLPAVNVYGAFGITKVNCGANNE